MSPLRDYRKRRNLAIHELAKLLDTSVATISRIENGLQDPQPEMMRKIALVTDGEITPNELLGVPVPPATVGSGQ